MSSQGLDYVLSDDFQRIVASDSNKWDKEWLRYLSMDKDYRFYFRDMSSDTYALSVSPRRISKFDRAQMHSTKLSELPPCQIWIDGEHVVDKDVLEMGCGPGFLGRLVGRFARRYVGLDVSPFALSIARLTSPRTCEYLHFV